jgi:predicted DNA-binding protein (MmcQ/YjbR family)
MIEAMIDYCRNLPHVVEDIKWETNRVFSIVGGKMFCVFSTEKDATTRMSFKVEDHRFLEMTDRSQFIPAPYMARARWVTLVDEQGLEQDELKSLVHRSYELYFAKLSKKAQDALNAK